MTSHPHVHGGGSQENQSGADAQDDEQPHHPHNWLGYQNLGGSYVPNRRRPLVNLQQIAKRNFNHVFSADAAVRIIGKEGFSTAAGYASLDALPSRGNAGTREIHAVLLWVKSNGEGCAIVGALNLQGMGAIAITGKNLAHARFGTELRAARQKKLSKFFPHLRCLLLQYTAVEHALRFVDLPRSIVIQEATSGVLGPVGHLLLEGRRPVSV